MSRATQTAFFTQSLVEPTARLQIPFFDGVNSIVEPTLAKPQELFHVENARSKTIGSIEKREGTRRLGNLITATANHGLFYFENTTVTNMGFYRISEVGSVVTIYYINNNATWTPLIKGGTNLAPIQMSTVQAEDCLFMVNGTDYNRYIKSDGLTVVGAIPETSLSPSVSPSYSPSVSKSPSVSPSKSPSRSPSVSPSPPDIPSFSPSLSSSTSPSFSFPETAIVEDNHLYGSPIAHKINYYKDQLYLADIIVGTRRLKNTIMFSSVPLGILTLIDGDYVVDGVQVTQTTSLMVTEIKYIRANDLLDIYRNGTKLGVITVIGKDSSTNTLTINPITFSILAADEVWVADTYDGTLPKQFRWSDNPSSGINVKQYDTFKVTGGFNDHITMMTNVGDYMVIGNTNNMALWNGSALKSFNLGIGCVSDNGYVMALGALWFVHYTGIYQTTGGMPQMMSSKVQRYIDGATKAGLEAAAVGKKGTSVFFAIGDVTLYHPDGSLEKTLSDVVLEYDVRQQNWYVHTNLKATQFATYFYSTNADRLEFASTDPSCPVVEFLRDSVDDSQGENREIPFRIDSNDISLGLYFETLCQPLRIIVETSRGSGIKFFVSLDGGRFYELQGEAIKGCVVLKVTNKDEDTDQPPRCRRIKFSIRDSSPKLCKINRVAIEYLQMTESEETKLETYEQ